MREGHVCLATLGFGRAENTLMNQSSIFLSLLIAQLTTIRPDCLDYDSE